MNWNNTKTESQYKTALIALLAGAGAGLAIGFLMAPKSGDRLRADIGTAVDEYLESAREKASELRASATSLAQRGLREVQKTKDNIAGQVKETVASAVEGGARDAHNAIDQTVAAVNTGARKSHEAVTNAADSVRTGTRG